jgi:hypothetical protein
MNNRAENVIEVLAAHLSNEAYTKGISEFLIGSEILTVAGARRALAALASGKARLVRPSRRGAMGDGAPTCG